MYLRNLIGADVRLLCMRPLDAQVWVATPASTASTCPQVRILQSPSLNADLNSDKRCPEAIYNLSLIDQQVEGKQSLQIKNLNRCDPLSHMRRRQWNFGQRLLQLCTLPRRDLRHGDWRDVLRSVSGVQPWLLLNCCRGDLPGGLPRLRSGLLRSAELHPLERIHMALQRPQHRVLLSQFAAGNSG